MNIKLKKFLKFLGFGILFQVAFLILVNLLVWLAAGAMDMILILSAYAYIFLTPVVSLFFGIYAVILLAMGNIKEKDKLKETATLWAGLFVSTALPWAVFYFLFGGNNS